MTPAISAYDLEIGTRTVWMEARGEGEEGMLGVAYALMNRVRSNSWLDGSGIHRDGPVGIASCCMLREQFSSWNTGNSQRQLAADVGDYDPVLVECRVAMGKAISQTVPDPTGGAMHYHDARMEQYPPWTVGATFTVQIGHHRFYKAVP